MFRRQISRNRTSSYDTFAILEKVLVADVMPPRLQCLNAARLIKQQDVYSRVAFSTTARALAGQCNSCCIRLIHVGLQAQLTRFPDEPSPTSSAMDLLNALSKDSPSPPSPSSPPHSRIRRPSFSTHPHSPPGPASTLRKPLPQGNSTSNARVLNLISRSAGRRAQQQPSAAERYQNTVQELKNHKLASDLTKQISRRWKAGDVYAPHDLSPVEMQKWKQRGRPERDVVDVLKLDVLGEYKVCILFLPLSSSKSPVSFVFT